MVETIGPNRADFAEVLYTPEEVAQYLKVSVPLIYKLIRRGRLRAVRVAKYLRMRHAWLVAYLEAGDSPR
jgi:excisionase family DNA binding protein